MADLIEAVQWEATIYQLETTDPVKGGNDGISNRQGKQLANRTAYLKNEVELRAPIESPEFTGNPSAPTPGEGDNTTLVATTEFVKREATRLKGVKKFESSSSFTVPVGVSRIYVSAVAGGGGGSGATTSTSAGGGGGAGQSIQRSEFVVSEGDVIPITIGAGGSGGAPGEVGSIGGNTIVGSLITLNAGCGGAQNGSGGYGYPTGAQGGWVANSPAGSGASGPFGGGGGNTSGNGDNGVGYGSGGGGANNNGSYIGGNGASGLVIIEW